MDVLLVHNDKINSAKLYEQIIYILTYGFCAMRSLDSVIILRFPDKIIYDLTRIIDISLFTIYLAMHTNSHYHQCRKNK